MKRILSVQDISCIGKCSLTVALPVISAMGVECAIIPTAVLSTHTAFDGFTFRDLTSDIKPITVHWKKEGFTFDAIYTGYLGSFEQLRLVSDIIDQFPSKVCIDPVMGDNGKLYPGFTPEFAFEMAKLCGRADVILPNMTEASYMLGTEYIASGYDGDYVLGVLEGLCGLGAKSAVLTGVDYGDGRVGVVCLEKSTGKTFSYFRDRIGRSFHGTGDVFASATVGALMNGFCLEEAIRIAVDYTVACISHTASDPNSNNYGVDFESQISYLLSLIGR